MATQQNLVTKSGLDINGTLIVRSSGIQQGALFNDSSALNLQAGSGSTAGLKIGTTTNTPIIGYTNGLERFRTDGSGNFLVGVPSSSTYGIFQAMAPSTYSGNIADFVSAGYAGQAQVRMRNSFATGAPIYSVYQNANTGYGLAGGFAVGIDSNGNAHVAQNGNSYLALWTSALERVRVDASGNVGVGVTNPSYKLVVAGDIDTQSGVLRRSGNVFVKSTGAETFIGPGGSGVITFHSSSTLTGGDETVRIDSNGNVGIGVSSPGARLHVVAPTGTGAVVNFVSDANVAAHVTTSLAGGTAGIYLNGLNSNGVSVAAGRIFAEPDVVTSGANSRLTFHTRDSSAAISERMRIDSNGNVGIGGSSPIGYRLSIQDTTNAAARIVSANESAGVGAAYLVFGSATYNRAQLATVQVGTAGADLVISTAPSAGGLAERMRIDSNGNVGIGGTPAQKFDVIGTTDTAAQIRTTGTVNSAFLSLSNGDGTTAGRYSYVRFFNNDATGQQWRIGTYGSNNFTIRDHLVGTTRFVIDTAGNVGVNTAAPSGLLHMRGTTGTTLIVDSSATTTGAANTGSQIEFWGSDGVTSYTWARIGGGKENGTSGDQASYFSIQTRANGGSLTERFRIDSTGDLVIPGGKGLCWGDKTTFIASNSLNTYIGLVVTGAERLRVDSSGNVGIGVIPDSDTVGNTLNINNGFFGSLFGPADYAFLSANAKPTTSLDAGSTVWKYKNNAYATRFDTRDGLFRWFTASSGNPGATITWNAAMSLDNSGNLRAKSFTMNSPGGTTSTGMTAPASDTLALFTNTIERIRIDSTGNVGIGTSPSASYRLHVQSTGSNQVASQGTTDASFITNVNGIQSLYLHSTTTSSEINELRAVPLLFTVNAAERMRIDSSGNVGIGLTDPTTVLTGFSGGSTGVAIASAGVPTLALYDSENSTYKSYVANSSGDMYVSNSATGKSLIFSNAGSERMRIDSSGNVNIGGGTIGAKFSVSDNSTATLQITPSSAVTDLVSRNSTNTGYTSARYTASQHVFRVNGSEYVRIDTSGNVGIGDSTPTATGGALSILTTSGSYNALILGDTNAYNAAPMAQLHFRLKVNSSNGTATVAYIKGAKENSISGDNSGYLAFHTSSASSVVERVRIDSSGSLLVGTVASTYGNTGRGLIEINGTNDVVLGLRIGGVAKGYVQVNVNNDFVIANHSNSTMSFVNNGLERVQVSTGGMLLVTGGVGLGYGPGAGGVVVQSTNKSTSVTLNKPSGQITLSNAALAANATVAFPLSNSTIAANDTVQVNLKSGYATSATYQVWAEGISAGACAICVRNISGGSLSEALVLNFTITKGSAA